MLNSHEHILFLEIEIEYTVYLKTNVIRLFGMKNIL